MVERRWRRSKKSFVLEKVAKADNLREVPGELSQQTYLCGG
jgi:hypothetical protein